MRKQPLHRGYTRSFALSLLLAGLSAQAEPPALPPLKAFVAAPAFSNLSLSPDGKYIATTVTFTDGGGLAVIRLADHQLISKIGMGQARTVAAYWWANSNRLIIEPAAFHGSLEAPLPTGELFAMDADGKNQKYLYGTRGEQQTGTLIHKVGHNSGAAQVIGILPDDPEHVVIAVNGFHEDAGRLLIADDSSTSETYLLNVNSGQLSDRGAPPVPRFTSFLPDWHGAVRYAVTAALDHVATLTYARHDAKSEWQPVNKEGRQRATLIPLRFAGDNQRVFLRSDEVDGRFALLEENLGNGESRVLSSDPQADFDAPVYSFDGREVIAALYQNGKTRVVATRNEHPDQKLLQSLQASFPGQVVVPVSGSQDGRLVLLEVYSDRDPGGYYLFDTKTLQASPLVARQDGILPEDMGERRPIRYQTADGLEINGYLTLPAHAKEQKNLPMVVLPHGGPFTIADQWRWDGDAQLLASRGYAVLQVNYRGSGGYGDAFLLAGRQHWDTMVDDINAGAHWAIAQGYADPQRVCIYGASFGGYAALRAATKDPELYRCTIGYAGVYDLNLQTATSDTAETRGGRNFLAEYIGNDKAVLAAASPITHLDRLQAAVMIVHGADDERVPVAQAKALRRALDERHYPYEWLVKDGEGHGFYKLENRVELYEKLLAFLDRNIGANARPPAAVSSPAQP